MALNATTALDPKTTALILIEYQNDFTTEGGTLHGGVKAVMETHWATCSPTPSSSSNRRAPPA